MLSKIKSLNKIFRKPDVPPQDKSGPVIQTKSDIINWFARTYYYKSYLEISTFTTGNFFDQVDEALYTTKDCLNYNPDDFPKEFFENSRSDDHNIPFMEYEQHLERIRNSHGLFDVILVDPYHTFEQSVKDIETALRLVSDQGVIVVHDCNPPEEELIRETWVPGGWCGQTYQSFLDFRLRNPYIETFVVDIDYGCGIIRKRYPALKPLFLEDGLQFSDIVKWEYFYENRKKLLNLITVEEFLNHYRKRLMPFFFRKLF
jgi:hypothetical protein